MMYRGAEACAASRRQAFRAANSAPPRSADLPRIDPAELAYALACSEGGARADPDRRSSNRDLAEHLGALPARAEGVTCTLAGTAARGLHRAPHGRARFDACWSLDMELPRTSAISGRRLRHLPQPRAADHRGDARDGFFSDAHDLRAGARTPAACCARRSGSRTWRRSSSTTAAAPSRPAAR